MIGAALFAGLPAIETTREAFLDLKHGPCVDSCADQFGWAIVAPDSERSERHETFRWPSALYAISSSATQSASRSVMLSLTLVPGATAG